MLLAGCASIKSVKQPFVDIGIDGQPQVIETLAPDWYFLQY
jgi:hypothetical protein